MSGEQNKKTTRRGFLAGSTGFAAGLALGSTALTELVKADDSTQAQGQEQEFVYEPVDAEEWALKAYENYGEFACGEGTFFTLVQSQAEEVGEPYESLPTQIFSLAAGGGAGWATLCGAPNGAMGFISLVEPGTGALANELMAWYSQTQLPLDKFDEQLGEYDLVKSKAGTPLCHASISNWLEESGKNMGDPERAERCGKVVSSVVYKTIKMLNAEVDEGYEPELTVSRENDICMSCHGSNWLDNTFGKMNCDECHDSSTAHENLFK